MNNFNKAGNMGNMGSSDAKANILMGGSASTSFSSAMGLQQQQQTNMPNNQFSQFRGNQNNMMLRSEASMDMGDEMNPYNTNDAFHPSNYSNPQSARMPFTTQQVILPGGKLMQYDSAQQQQSGFGSGMQGQFGGFQQQQQFQQNGGGQGFGQMFQQSMPPPQQPTVQLSLTGNAVAIEDVDDDPVDNPAIGASIDAEAGAGVGVGVGGYSSEEPPVSTYVDEYPDLLELPPQPRYDVFCPGYVPCMPPPVSI
jgi:hypothetical protein